MTNVNNNRTLTLLSFFLPTNQIVTNYFNLKSGTHVYSPASSENILKDTTEQKKK